MATYTPTFTATGPVTTRSPPYPTIPAGSTGIIICNKWIGSEKHCIEYLTICYPISYPTGKADSNPGLYERLELAATTTTGVTSASTSVTTSSTTPTATKSGATQLSKSGIMIMAMLFAAAVLA
ncbi:hypothetical protein BGW38_000301 [Lunasporangiospora selenospora]|uniref:Uncharacterized protein n=1 Tax=Lunasporangiospora selenospora TaxID=979761 RepID=A0A9P6G1M9_9FUNG|nr:hypothetical protein BGW38_000301 [Lunasporangiospora selenospora]